MTVDNLFGNIKAVKEEMVLYQNCLPTRVPAFCTKPTWFVNGLEKKVKIGKKIFNAVDYMEAWCNINCFTYRSNDALEKIYLDIKKAFVDIE